MTYLIMDAAGFVIIAVFHFWRVAYLRANWEYDLQKRLSEERVKSHEAGIAQGRMQGRGEMRGEIGREIAAARQAGYDAAALELSPVLKDLTERVELYKKHFVTVDAIIGGQKMQERISEIDGTL